MIISLIILLIILQWYSWRRYKDFLNPAVIHNVFWILSISGLCILLPRVDISLKTFSLILGGAIAFQLGFSMIRVRNVKEKVLYLNPFAIKMSIAILFIPFFIVMVQYYRSGLFLDSSVYDSLKDGKEELEIPAYMSYVFKFIQFFTLAILILYWKAKNKGQRIKIKKWIVFLFIMGLVCTLSTPTRNSMLFFLAPLIMIYLYTHNMTRKKIFLLMFVGLFIFLLYFYFVSLGKYWYKYDNGESPYAILGREILGYLSASIYALDLYIDKHEFTRFGADTFRYFLAIYDSIFKTNYCPELVNDFINKEINTNVYTFYDYYLRDFGLLYAIIAQFIYSALHAYTYKNAKRGSLLSVFFAAMLSYPLLMQFFQDQYASIMSLWVQAAIVAVLVFKTNIFKRETVIGVYNYG